MGTSRNDVTVALSGRISATRSAWKPAQAGAACAPGPPFASRSRKLSFQPSLSAGTRSLLLSGALGGLLGAKAPEDFLTGANTYTGTTTISTGALQVGNAGATGTLGTGAVVETIADVNTSNTSDFSNLPSGWSTPLACWLETKNSTPLRSPRRGSMSARK